jgi:hypothetical protein
MESKVAFEGAVPVAFAFQAVQLVFDDSGEFLTTEQLPRAMPRRWPYRPFARRAVPSFSKLAALSRAWLMESR